MKITNKTSRTLRIEVSSFSKPELILELEPKETASSMPSFCEMNIYNQSFERSDAFVKWLLIDLDEVIKDIKREIGNESVNKIIDKHLKKVKDKWG